MLKYVFATLLFFASTAQAQFLQNFSVELGAELPTQLGLRVNGDLNNEFLIKVGVGYLPSFFSGMVGSMALGSSSSETPLLSESVADSLLFDVSIGYKFSGSFNPYIILGYTSLNNGGGTVNGDAMYEFTNGGLNPPSNYEYTVSSTLSALSIKLGMKYQAGPSLTLSLEGGITKPISSNNSIDHFTLTTIARDNLNDDMKNAWSNSTLFTVGAWAIINI